jgi:hypothetical protein
MHSGPPVLQLGLRGAAIRRVIHTAASASASAAVSLLLLLLLLLLRACIQC